MSQFVTGAATGANGLAAQVASNNNDYAYSRFEANAGLQRAEFDRMAADLYYYISPLGNKSYYDDMTYQGAILGVRPDPKDMQLLDEYYTLNGQATNDLVSNYNFTSLNAHTRYEYFEGQGYVTINTTAHKELPDMIKMTITQVITQGFRVWHVAPTDNNPLDNPYRI
jgi:hypothetical protein